MGTFFGCHGPTIFEKGLGTYQKHWCAMKSELTSAADLPNLYIVCTVWINVVCPPTHATADPNLRRQQHTVGTERLLYYRDCQQKTIIVKSL